MKREYTVTLKAPLFKYNFYQALKAAVPEQVADDYMKELEYRLKCGGIISSIEVTFEINIKEHGTVDAPDNTAGNPGL